MSILRYNYLFSYLDEKVLYDTVKFHHRGSFLRNDLIEDRRFMYSTENVKNLLIGEMCYTHNDEYISLEKITKRNKTANTRGRSQRIYTDDGRCNIKDISEILSESFGVEDTYDDGVSVKPYPSAGTGYPIDVHIGILEDCEIKKGVYHYKTQSHSLEQITDKCIYETILGHSSNIEGRPSFILIYVVNMAKALVKYRYRGYRFALMETGSMYQQVSTVAYSYNYASLVYSTYSDFQIMKFLNLNNRYFSTLAVQLFGHETT